MVLVQQFLPTPTKSHLRDFKQFQVKISSIPGTEILLSFRSWLFKCKLVFCDNVSIRKGNMASVLEKVTPRAVLVPL